MANTYTIEFNHRGNLQTIQAPDDRTILESADEAGLELPRSCTAGVCTTCAAQILEGKVDQSDGMGLSPDLAKDGYVLLCVAYPRSDLKLATEKEDTVYHLQFGQFQQ